MKIPVATSISLLGVLTAGGIAFAVNTSVLNTATSTSTYSPAVQAQVIPVANDLTAVAAAAEPASAVGNSVTETTGPAAPTTAAPAPGVTTTAYDVAGYGVVTVAQTGDSLAVNDVRPLAGVTYEVEQESPSRIEVEFRAANGQAVEFRAALVSGRIVTSVVNDTESYQSATREDDHEDDDHHDEREVDDDHHEREDDDHDDD